jgi:phospholipid-transporting ATPase
LYDELEQELSYLGCTAIEDKLQEDVPETISHLMEAKIKLWVLTGDKQETAIEIAKSCNLINIETMDMIVLTARTRTEFVIRLREAFNEFPRPGKKMSLVIDGITLNHVLSDEVLATLFIKLGWKANSVIICRASPKQKADIITIAKKNGPWITMAIGDGANDVPMLMEAHIGVGMRGREGT